MEASDPAQLRTCSWCGSNTPSAYPICQKCNRHKSFFASHTHTFGIVVSFLMVAFATVLYIDTSSKQQELTKSISEVNAAVIKSQHALADSRKAAKDVEKTLAQANRILSIAQIAAEEASIANSQAMAAMTHVKKPTKTLKPKVKTKTVTRAKPTKRNSSRVTSSRPVKILSPAEKARSRALLVSRLEKAKAQLTHKGKEFDNNNGDKRFLLTAREYQASRNSYTKIEQDEIARLEKQLDKH